MNDQIPMTNFDPQALSFRRDDWGCLLLQAPGLEKPIIVEPVRCFPLTHPEEHVSLLDDTGREVLRIASLNELTGESRRLLEKELAEREFSPIIQRILEAGAAVPCNWDVETDRGVTRFQIDSEDEIRRLPNGAIILTDANGIRFRIPNVEDLDANSRTILRRFL
jgi:hypothetical protein